MLAGVAEGAAVGVPEANPGFRWVLALLDLADLEPSLAARLANRYQYDLLERLENETGLDTQMTLMIATRACLSRLSAADPGNAGWQRDLSVSHHKLAMYTRQRQDLAGFVEHSRECFAVLHRMKQRGLHFDPQMARVYQQLARMFGGR